MCIRNNRHYTMHNVLSWVKMALTNAWNVAIQDQWLTNCDKYSALLHETIQPWIDAWYWRHVHHCYGNIGVILWQELCGVINHGGLLSVWTTRLRYWKVCCSGTYPCHCVWDESVLALMARNHHCAWPTEKNVPSTPGHTLVLSCHLKAGKHSIPSSVCST